MELTNEFHVSVPIDVAWAVLTDLERVAPCMPGAELQEVEGDEYRGVVKVKVGPISAQYKGTARFVEKDDAHHRAVLLAEGRDTRGQGNASATVTARAIPDDGGTTVSIVTELSITGKVAQFGRSVMGDVSTKMLGEFADRLEADVLSQGSGPESNEPVTETTGESRTTAEEPDPLSEESDPSSVRTIHSAPAEPVDLLGTAGPSVLKRVVPLVIGASLIFLLWRRRRKNSPA
jgi:carbon monoxide dehydrogenase subunit G